MHESRQQKLSLFTEWVARHITGDEKGEAQIFLDRLFQAFGQKGSLDVGGTPELRVRKSSEDGGGTSFADYVWRPVVLIEMKKRGVDLARHREQAFQYWIRIVPDRPRYAVLCNFDEFWVYDFNTQLDTPKDKVKLADLPDRWGPLAFLFPTREAPTFENDREAVTREAADKLALCYTKLEARRVDEDLRRRFILQMLVSLFSEDIGLLPKYTISQLLDECKSPADTYDLLGGLFEAMNTPGGVEGGRYKGVRYFNGGLFEHPACIELYDDEINQLKGAARSDWSKVSPEIFGTIFEHSLGKEQRHAFGAHFTSPVDIMKIVEPTIVRPWREQIEGARTLKRLNELLDRMRRYRVLDPACGSGNFLYIAYRELKRLEARLFERIGEYTSTDPQQGRLSFVTARQFYGLDINKLAVELAKVSMMIARKLAIDELHIHEQALPLDNLDENFIACDALISPGADGNGAIQTPWPEADVIIGNPPFLGAKRLKPERGAAYVNAVRKLYKNVPGMADYCVYWIRRAHDHLPECTPADPLAGRAGLVGTQNIRNNQSRVGGLDHVVRTGTIIEAVDNQPWSGEANVHVSIASWMKTQDEKLVPAERKLWTKVQQSRGGKRSFQRGRNAGKSYELQDSNCDFISAALSGDSDVSSAEELQCNKEPQRCFQGVIPGYEGYVLEPGTAAQMIEADSKNRDVVHPFLIGRDLVTGDGTPSRSVIDFGGHDILSAQRYAIPFRHLEEHVLPDVRAKVEDGESHDDGRKAHLDLWWTMWRFRPDMLAVIGDRKRFVACADVTKRPIFAFVASEVRPDHQIRVFVFDDDYSYGIIQSYVHWLWLTTKGSKLTERFRYSSKSVFDTLPWPQFPTKKQVDAVAEAGREVRRVRAEALTVIKGGLRAVYRTLELPGRHPLKEAHASLDAVVLAAYGFSPRKDLLKQLLDLNHAVAAKEKAGEPVTAPGVPAVYGDPSPLITDDCIRP